MRWSSTRALGRLSGFHAAGADLPAALIAWASGEAPDPRCLRLRPGVTAAKCDRLVTVTSLPSH